MKLKHRMTNEAIITQDLVRVARPLLPQQQTRDNTMVVVQRTSKQQQQKQQDSIILPQVPEKLSPGLVAAHLVNLVILLTVLHAAASFDNATEAMAFYGVYHSQPLNQLIHFFGVPLLLWTVIIFQAHLPFSSHVIMQQLPGIPAHYVSWATISMAFYIVSYLRMDLFGGTLYLFILYAIYASAVRWTAQDQRKLAQEEIMLASTSSASSLSKKQAHTSSWTGTGRVLKWASLAHILAWYVQIHPGHKISEGGQPALMQSLGGALYSAPLFAFYEGIWFVGLRWQFQQQVLALVADYTKELCEAGAAMRVCESLLE